MVVPLLYNLTVIIARCVFLEFQREYLVYWILLDYLSDTMYAIDITVQFRKGYLDQGILVQDSRKIAINYIKTFRFKLDVISLVPTDILYAAFGIHTPGVRMNRILRTYRLSEYFERTITRTNSPNIHRVIHLVVTILTIIHWNACLYYALSSWIGFGTDNWVYPSLNVTENNRLSRKYLRSFYWSTLTLSTIGDTPPPITDIEQIFVIVNFLIGVLIFATIVGNAGTIIANMNSERTTFQNKMDQVKRYMKFQNIQPTLETRVIQWFDYLWCNKQGFQKENMIEMLPDNLKSDIAVQVHLPALQKVELFKCCEPNLLKEIVLKLKLQIFSPDDYICRKGDIGKEMYIIKTGNVQVTGDDEATPLATLGPGSVFGEISILDIPGLITKNKRTANVKAVGYSDIFILSKSDLEEVLKDYPKAKAKLIETGTAILRKDNLISEPTANVELPSELPAAKMESLERSMSELNTYLKFFQAEIKEIQARLTEAETHIVCKTKKATLRPASHKPTSTKSKKLR